MLHECNAARARDQQTVVIADKTVADLHLQRLRAHLPGDSVVLTFPPGETSKSLGEVGRLYDQLAQARIERDALIVTFGGGVASDLGGFVAATWLRGIRFAAVPTTLLAAIDASVGGKTGVNLPGGKNLIGAFHQPVAVIIDTGFLQTLPDRELRAGLAESVKHAAVRDAEFLAWHEGHAEALASRNADATAALIARNCEIKAEVVALDEREAGLRAILNHGHTLGHALEHLLGYELRHGECVALGMLAENELACLRGLLPRATADRIRDLLERLGLPLRLPQAVDLAQVVAACRLDKKVRHGAINFVLLRELGQPVRVADVSEAEISAALATIQPARLG
jgi:3-dehydroquinate synthase